MIVHYPNGTCTLAIMAFMMRFYFLISFLTCLQEAQVVALPTGNATGLFPTKKNTTTQYPPTTTVRNTTPGTEGVSSCSTCHQSMKLFQVFIWLK